METKDVIVNDSVKINRSRTDYNWICDLFVQCNVRVYMGSVGIIITVVFWVVTLCCPVCLPPFQRCRPDDVGSKYNPEESHLRHRRRENLKSHWLLFSP